ncbi:MAG: hypothetical protein ACI8V2_003759 [Candidatus Latescibacterota bacterium]|jgi:hypothetical protein
MPIQVVRSKNNPIITPESDERIGGNINGPALIRVPDWVQNPLGQYYLYFAHHQGKFIRMAYADHVAGPYTVYTPGVLAIEDTPILRHIASPDVHIDHDNQKIYMIYHGSGFEGEKPDYIGQLSVYADSTDGLSFTSEETCLGPSYMRIFSWEGYTYGFGAGGGRNMWRTKNIHELFEKGPQLPIDGEDFTDLSDTSENIDKNVYRTRHPGLHVRGHELDIYYSNVGDHPERIKRTTVDLRPDWTEWKGSAPVEILHTGTDYEGLHLPNGPSSGGASHEPVHQVRDPYIFIEGKHKYLVYSVAGEKGLGVAEIIES